MKKVEIVNKTRLIIEGIDGFVVRVGLGVAVLTAGLAQLVNNKKSSVSTKSLALNIL